MSSKPQAPPWGLVWDASLSVGVPEIDLEHQVFIHLVNELNEGIITRLSKQEIIKRLEALLLDATQHFAHEEALFELWRYPRALEHTQEHREILGALNNISKRFQQDCSEYELIESGLDVKAALIEHLLSEDMKYRNYGGQMNVKPCVPEPVP